MKTWWLLLSMVFLCTVAGAGTSVGNFNRKLQREFDFEVRYPTSWSLTAQQSVTTPETVETWLVVNSPTVAAPGRQSKIQFSFTKNFPAKNQTELLKEIQKRHPSFEWKAVQNPDFVGYASTALDRGQNSWTNMEYYLTDIGKVVEIDVTRNADGNGAAEADLILSTIRKPSLPVSIDSVSYSQDLYHPGDRACISVKVDALKLGPSPSINLILNDEMKHWKFRDQKFDPDSGVFEVCLMMTRAMPNDALFIQKAIVNTGSGTIVCDHVADKLVCSGANQKRSSSPIKTPVFKNESPDQSGPQVLQFSATPDQSGFILNCTDESGVDFVQVEFQDGTGSTKHQMILFEDELKDPAHVYTVPTQALVPGYNLIRRLTLFDKIGNVTVLYAGNASEKNYLSVFQKQKSEISKIPYVSIRKP